MSTPPRWGSKNEADRAHRVAAAATNVHVLENDSVEISGVIFLGAVGWTGFNLFGKPTALPKPGTVVVLSFNGLEHVGFYFGDEGEFIRILDGNQNDEVCVYRYLKSAVKGYRNPV